VRTRHARPVAPQLDGERAGGLRSATPVRSFTGELVGASEDEVTLAADDGIIAIPYADISRSNLIED
jgi:ribosome maturation factor RimP